MKTEAHVHTNLAHTLGRAATPTPTPTSAMAMAMAMATAAGRARRGQGRTSALSFASDDPGNHSNAASTQTG